MSKLAQLKRITDGGPEGEPNPPTAEGNRGLKEPPSCLAIFFVIFWKKVVFLIPFGLHFTRFQSHLKEQSF